MLLSDNNDGYCALSYLCKSNLCCSDVEPCNTATQDSNHEICQFKIKIIELSVFYSMKIYKWPTIIGESPRHVKPSVPCALPKQLIHTPFTPGHYRSHNISYIKTNCEDYHPFPSAQQAQTPNLSLTLQVASWRAGVGFGTAYAHRSVFYDTEISSARFLLFKTA